MVTRDRDLDAFAYGDPRDVRVVDCGEGLELVAIGMLPERRLLLEAFYGLLTLKNGIPIGYVGMGALFSSAEIAYNVFDTWRGSEAAKGYSAVLTAAATLFGADAFLMTPYQLGDDNEEGIESGAWWFYQKLGFRPRDPAAIRLMRRETARIRRNRRYRSSPATLRRLARHPMFLWAGRERDDIMGILPLENVGLAAMQYVARQFGSDREEATRVCGREAAVRLGVRWPIRWSRAERLWWDRWAPLVMCLPGVERWSPADRRALVDVIRAKGGRSESEYVRRFDTHFRLTRATDESLQRASEFTPLFRSSRRCALHQPEVCFNLVGAVVAPSIVLEVVREVDRGHAARAELALDPVTVRERERRGGTGDLSWRYSPPRGPRRPRRREGLLQLRAGRPRSAPSGRAPAHPARPWRSPGRAAGSRSASAASASGRP